MSETGYISAPEAGRLLGISADSIHRLCDGGKLEFAVPLKQRRIKLASVIEYRNRVTRGRCRVAVPAQLENLLRD